MGKTFESPISEDETFTHTHSTVPSVHTQIDEAFPSLRSVTPQRAGNSFSRMPEFSQSIRQKAKPARVIDLLPAPPLGFDNNDDRFANICPRYQPVFEFIASDPSRPWVGWVSRCLAWMPGPKIIILFHVQCSFQILFSKRIYHSD